jgi:hypothetical protein
MTKAALVLLLAFLLNVLSMMSQSETSDPAAAPAPTTVAFDLDE